MVYALFVAVVCLIFAVQTGNDFRQRRRPYQAIWTAALVMSTIGSLGYAVAVQWGSELGFRLYYIFGALAVAPVMGMGSVYLSMSRRLADRLMWLISVLIVVGAILLFGADIDRAALTALSGGSGQGVLLPGPWLFTMILLNLFGTVAVAGIAVYSAWRALRNKSDVGFMWGNLVIGLGFLIVAMAGSVARWFPAWDGGFWMAMALGWLVAYVGFRVVTKAAEARRGRSHGVAGGLSKKS